MFSLFVDVVFISWSGGCVGILVGIFDVGFYCACPRVFLAAYVGHSRPSHSKVHP